MSSPQVLEEFFSFMWGNETGFVYLPTKSDGGEWRKVMYPWPKSKDAVIQHVITASAAGKDIYFSPAIFNEPRPVKENVKGSHVLWVDFDGSAPSEWNLPDSGIIPTPSLRIQSSSETHQHVYWRLDHFTTDITFVEEKNRALAYSLNADTSGWDINQVLRPPETTNHKHGVVVTVAEESSDRFPRDRFALLKAAKQLVNESLNLKSLVPVEDILAKYNWDQTTYELFRQPNLPDGQRSTSLVKLGYFGAEQGMTDEEIFSILVHADDRWGKYAKRDDRQKRLVDIINRARHKHPTPLTDIDFAGLKSETPVETDVRYVYSFKEFSEAEFKINWLLPGLVIKQGVCVLAARGGVGKTQLSYQLACHAALKKQFLKFRTPDRGINSLMLSLEMGPISLRIFHDTISKGYDPTELSELNERFKIAPVGEPVPLDKPHGRQFIETILEKHQPELVIVDSLSKLVIGDLKDDTLMRMIFNYLAVLRSRFGCAFWLIHHNRKATSDNKKPTDISDIYGSQYITSEPDTAFTMWRGPDQNDHIELFNVKNRLAPEYGVMRLRRTSTLNFETIAGVNEVAFGGLESEVKDDNPKSETLLDFG
jgi:AAA domain